MWIRIIFKKFRVPFNRLAWAENMDHAIRFSVWSRVDDFKSILYGTYETTVSRLNDYARIGKIEWRDLQNEKAKVKVGGFIKIKEFQILEQPNFLEYLKSGWFINLSVAIDFTASNGDRHNIKFGQENDYEIAIQEVGKILEPYAYKKKFAGYGFGGIPTYAAAEKVKHCFNLNGLQDPTI